MRICLISREFIPRTGFGGAAFLYADLASALTELGHEITVLAGNNRKGVDIVRDSTMTRVLFKDRLSRPNVIRCVAREFSVLKQYCRIVSQEGDFDIVEAPDIDAESLAVNTLRGEHASVVRLITPHFVLAEMDKLHVSLVRNLMERTNASLSDVILADCLGWAKNILREWRISESKLRLCPLGIDLRRIDSVPNGDPAIEGEYVLFAGRLTVAKGPQVLAAAAPHIISAHPGVKIVFVGADTLMRDGKTLGQHILNSIPKKVLNSVMLLGFVDSWEKLVNIYRNAAVCVKADASGNHSYDAFGQMACGKPLVCTKTEGYMDMIVDNVNGCLFDRDNPLQLAEIVNRLLDDEGLRRTMGHRARETIVQKYSSSVLAKETIRWYEEALSGLER